MEPVDHVDRFFLDVVDRVDQYVDRKVIYMLDETKVRASLKKCLTECRAWTLKYLQEELDAGNLSELKLLHKTTDEEKRKRKAEAQARWRAKKNA